MIDHLQLRSRVDDRNLSEFVCIRLETRNVFLGAPTIWPSSSTTKRLPHPRLRWPR
jgi:hypothetical protein